MLRKYVLAVVLLMMAGCTAASSASIPIDLSEPITISNSRIILRVTQVSDIEEKQLVGGQSIRRTADTPAWLRILEVTMSYENRTEDSLRLDHRHLSLTFPDSDEVLIGLAFCEPQASNPYGPPVWCAEIPQTQPGVYGITGVFQMPNVSIEPGREGKFSIIVAIPDDMEEFVLAFADESDE